MQKIGSITTTADANGEWTNGNVAAGISPTIMDAAWFNTIQRELANIVTSGGLTLDPANDAQVLAALKKIFFQTANNLSEIAAAGTAAQASARSAIAAAALAGLATQVFNVSTATANAHAVPLLQMNTALGLKASISSFSPGSNGNGVYYSYPGGLQICRGNIIIQANSSSTWTYPLAFSSAPQVFYTALIPAGSGTPSAMWINSIATGSVSIYNPNSQATQINLLGIL